MRINGTYSITKFTDSFEFVSTEGENIFSLKRVGIANNKLVISGLEDKYNYFGELAPDKNGNPCFVLSENEHEILRITEISKIMRATKFEIESDSGSYEVDVNSKKTDIIITNGGETSLKAEVDNKNNYEIIINNAENPVFNLSILVGVMSLIAFDNGELI